MTFQLYVKVTYECCCISNSIRVFICISISISISISIYHRFFICISIYIHICISISIYIYICQQRPWRQPRCIVNIYISGDSPSNKGCGSCLHYWRGDQHTNASQAGRSTRAEPSRFQSSRGCCWLLPSAASYTSRSRLAGWPGLRVGCPGGAGRSSEAGTRSLGLLWADTEHV